MNKYKLVTFIPIIGIGIYFVLFIYSASKYPGGSRIHPEHIGFDWIHNYWCDLMAKQSYNGLNNLARPSAITAWVIVCVSIVFIFWQAVNRFYPFGKWHTIFKMTSVITGMIGIFSFTDYHDLAVLICFPFAAITTIGLTIGLLKSNLRLYKNTVWICLLCLSASFFMYFTNIGLHYLGLLQKITLIITMVWLVGFHISLLQHAHSTTILNERI